MIVPKNGDFIKHKNFMDVAIYIQKYYVFENRVKVKGIWANQHFVETDLIGLNARIAIDKKDLNDWFICLDPTKKCIRDAEWRPLK